jgi:endonuclease/exonuclease/phosphatase family metal-dependent hydrolase
MYRMKALLAVAAAVAALAAPAASAEQPHPFKGDRQVTVMTRNLYLGTDFGPIFRAPSLPALFAAVGAGWLQVQRNDFPARAEAIADEIAAAEPDLVGLQEAALFRTDVPPDGPATPAETVAFDYLVILEAALEKRGLDYAPVAVFTGTDAELPAGLPPTLDIRFTDRVVVLARQDEKTADLKLSNPASGAFPTALTVRTAAGPLTTPRGWASVDVKIRGSEFRFVTAHLDAFAAPVRNAQALELLAGPAASDLPVVAVGDFNSGPGTDQTAYRELLAGGLEDAWPSGPFTCCFASELTRLDRKLTSRVDLVLSRGGFDVLHTDIVGETLADRTPSGLWPSDHAGVVATLRVPDPDEERP